ncbi:MULTISPECIES: RNA polymerase sigma factor [unclassified Knoellia]|uniref:RNA polymerase sigma factor n=1 Tax=Knoellia altitudinis TaxID=3404795 RepID=UPI0036167EFE
MTALERVVREEWGRLVALLLAQFRRLDLVEDALADAVATAQTRWPDDGEPDNPSAWLVTAARRRILDRLRAETMAARKEPLLLVEATRQPQEGVMADDGSLVDDDLLRLVLMCAHPALPPEGASALSLRLVMGISTADVARLFLVPEATMAARITRAKKKIVTAGIPFAIPGTDALGERLDVVAHTAYLAFTAGYAPGSGPDLLRAELAGEAIRLARVTHALRPTDTLAHLIALMALQHSRRDARVAPDGSLVLLPDQDRRRWHHDEIAEALALLEATEPPVPVTALSESFRLQARIAAEHATAPSPEATRWDRITTLYAVLEQVTPSPAVRVARAVAVAEAEGPRAGLLLLDGVELPGHRLPAVRGELLARAGDRAGASEELARAMALCDNVIERAHLSSRLGELA